MPLRTQLDWATTAAKRRGHPAPAVVIWLGSRRCGRRPRQVLLLLGLLEAGDAAGREAVVEEAFEQLHRAGDAVQRRHAQLGLDRLVERAHPGAPETDRLGSVLLDREAARPD